MRLLLPGSPKILSRTITEVCLRRIPRICIEIFCLIRTLRYIFLAEFLLLSSESHWMNAQSIGCDEKCNFPFVHDENMSEFLYEYDDKFQNFGESDSFYLNWTIVKVCLFDMSSCICRILQGILFSCYENKFYNRRNLYQMCSGTCVSHIISIFQRTNKKSDCNSEYMNAVAAPHYLFSGYFNVLYSFHADFCTIELHVNELTSCAYFSNFLDCTERASPPLAVRTSIYFSGDIYIMRLIMSIFIFFVISMSVRYTLVETQTKMYKFTLSLDFAAKNNLSTLPLISKHVLDCLLFVPVFAGMLFILVELFNDQIIAFVLLLYIWLREVYVLVSSKSSFGECVYNGISFVLFIRFTLNYLNCSTHVVSESILTLSFSSLYALIYVWNRYDLPFLVL